MADTAYQVTDFAYQGIGEFAYQGEEVTPPVTTAAPRIWLGIDCGVSGLVQGPHDTTNVGG